MKRINPEWNKEFRRWEVPDEENESMRALNHYDLEYMADCVVAARGIEPALNEECVDRALAKLEKKYGILSPLPIWAAQFLDEYDKARDVCKPSRESVEKMLRKHAGI